LLSCGRLARPAHRPLHHSSRLAKIHEVGAGNKFNYEEVARSFQWEVPARFNFSRDVMDRWAETAGTRPALWWVEPQSGQEVKLSFSEVSDATQRAAAALAGLGVTRAVCILPRVPEWWIINLATVRAGIVLLPGTTQLTPRDIAGRLLSSAADCVICDPETAVKVDELEREAVAGVVARIVVGGERPGWMTWNKLYHAAPATHTAADTAASDTMQIYFTSGTTGKPKMVGHTHGSYGFCHWPMGKYWLDLTPEDLMWNISDTGWAKSAWSTIFGPWSQGATVFIHGMPRFTGPAVLDCLTRYPVSVLCAPPTLYRSLVQADLTSFSPAHQRHCVSAGEPLNEEVIYSWEEATGLVIKEGYGQTETTLLIGTFKKMSKWVKPGSMGKVAPGYDVRIVNNMGKEVARGEQGNIGVRCRPHWPPGLFQGYCEDSLATANAFCGDFYLTGDRGVQDEDGYFWFFSRQDDLIISSGYRIGPFEVESALIEHEAVLESAVVPSPDKERGQVVKAFIVLSDKFRHVLESEAEQARLTEVLQTHVKTTTAPYKYPRKIEFVTSLPKTVSGKIRRSELRLQETKLGRES